MTAWCRILSIIERHDSLERLDGEEMVIAPRQMRRADDHQPAYVAVRRDIADLRGASWTQEALALHLRVAYAETWGRGVR